MNRAKIINEISRILFYPGKDYKNHVQLCYEELKVFEELRSVFEGFNNYASLATQSELEENFTYTFDMNPSYCLDIGWHLFGEDYKRGEFLVTMRGLMRKFNVTDTNELPDHIYHVLQVANRMEEDERESFLDEFLRPSLKKIEENMDEENKYFPVIKTLAGGLKTEIVFEEKQNE